MKRTLKIYIDHLPDESPKQEIIRKIMDGCRVDRSTVNRWLNGKSKPDYLKCQMISSITDIPVEDLFAETSKV